MTSMRLRTVWLGNVGDGGGGGRGAEVRLAVDAEVELCLGMA